MTHYNNGKGNTIRETVIPAACLTILTLGSVSWWGNTGIVLLPAIGVIILVTIILIVFSRHTQS
jgi:hypothetical protein